MKKSRRHFIQQTALAGAGLLAGNAGFSAQSYRRIIGSNDRVRGRGRFLRPAQKFPYPLFHEPLQRAELRCGGRIRYLEQKKGGRRSHLERKRWDTILWPAATTKNYTAKN